MCVRSQRVASRRRQQPSPSKVSTPSPSPRQSGKSIQKITGRYTRYMYNIHTYIYLYNVAYFFVCLPCFSQYFRFPANCLRCLSNGNLMFCFWLLSFSRLACFYLYKHIYTYVCVKAQMYNILCAYIFYIYFAISQFFTPLRRVHSDVTNILIFLRSFSVLSSRLHTYVLLFHLNILIFYTLLHDRRRISRFTLLCTSLRFSLNRRLLYVYAYNVALQSIIFFFLFYASWLKTLSLYICIYIYV